MRRLPFLLGCLALCLAAAPAARGDEPPKTKKIANPEYANWSKFAVGAFVELTSTSESMGQKSSTTMTHKLVELTAQKAVIETAMQIPGIPAEYAPKPQRRDVAREIEVPDVQLPAAPPPEFETKEGEETIDVGGKPIKCKTFETTVKAGDMTTRSKTWTSDDLPGTTARMESRTEGKVGEQAFVSVSTVAVTKWAAR